MFTLLLGKIAILALILAVGVVIGSWGAQGVRAALSRTKLDPIARELLVSCVQPSAVAVAAYAALTTLQVDISPLLAVFGAAGLAIAFALKDSLSAVAAGALLLSIRAYEGGDTIQVAGQTGTVVEYDLFTVTLKAPDGALITVPNEVLLKNPVLNLTRNGLRRLRMELFLDHGAPLPDALALVVGTLVAHDQVVTEPAPSCVVTELTLDGATLAATAWVRPADLSSTRSLLLTAIDAALADAKIPRAKRPAIHERA